MSYRIAQDFSYAGHDYWHWWAWIEADAAELDAVEAVVWILHPTFKQSRVRVTDRASKFQLKTSGWGTFLLRAELELEGGAKKMLTHHLRLEHPQSSSGVASKDKATSAETARPLSVFLSYSGQDSREAAKVRRSLQAAGFKVVDQTSIAASDVVADTIRRGIAQADAVVALVCDEEISPWVRDELASGVREGKPAVALLWPQVTGAGLPGEVRTVQVDAGDLESAPIAELLRTVPRR